MRAGKCGKQTPRAYEPDPRRQSGPPNGEVCEMTQQQRYLERRIRECKRELRGAQQVPTGTLASRAQLAKAQERLKVAQSDMRGYIRECNAKSKTGKPILTRHPNREWAGDMPKSKTVRTSGRNLNEFLEGKAIQSQLKAKGVSASKVGNAIKAQLKARGLQPSDFKTLTASEQQGMFRSILDRMPASKRATAKANAGKHADTLAGVAKGQPMSFEKADGRHVNPDFDPLKVSTMLNCQSSVVAFEARLRGYDVEVMPYSAHSIMKEVAREPHVAWRDAKTGEIPEPAVLTGVNTPNRLLKRLEENVREGERYTFRYTTRGSGGSGGHIISLDRTPEGLRFYDPQSGEVFTGRAFRDKVRTDIEYKRKEFGLTVEYPVSILRVDNLDFNPDVADQILREAR